MRDVHLVELFKQAGLDMQKDIHLFLPIEEFVRNKEQSRDPWQFRVKPDGSKYWIHSLETVTKFEYPYLEELSTHIREYGEKFSPNALPKFVKDYNPLEVVLASPALLDKARRCKEATVRVLEDYFKLQYNDGEYEKNLRGRMLDIKAGLQQLLTIPIDLHEFITLVFFCEFDLEKFVMEKHSYDRKDEIYLKSMNPNLELNDKIEQIRIKERRKAARFRHSGMNTDSEGSVMGRTTFSQNSQLVRGTSFVEELGPAENYTHLFDQDLKNGNIPFISDKTKKLLHELDTIGELSTVLEECRSLISKNVNEINEEYLEKLLLDVRRLYRMIEKNDSEGSQSSLEALNKIQANIFIKKKQLETQKEQINQEQKAKEMADLLAIEMGLNKGIPPAGGLEKQSDQGKQPSDHHSLPDLLQNMQTKRSEADLPGSNIFEESAGKDMSDVNFNQTKGTLEDLRKLDLTHPESAQDRDSQRSHGGVLDDELNRAQSMRMTPGGGTLSPGAGVSPNSRNTIRFLSKENLNQLELYMKVLKEGENLARQESPRTRTMRQLEEVKETIEQSDVQIKELQIIHKELQNMKPQDKKQTNSFKVVDKHGRIVEVQRLTELEQRWKIIRKETDEDSECSDDETVIYEEVNHGSLRKRKIKRTQLIQSHKAALQQLDSKIQQKVVEKAIGEITREFLLKRINLFEMFAQDIKTNRTKTSTSGQSEDLIVQDHKATDSKMFSRMNHNLPISMRNMPHLKQKVQEFILKWMGRNTGLSAGTLNQLLSSPEKQTEFFQMHSELYELVLETLLKRPNLYAKVKQHVYSVQKPTVPEASRQNKEKTISSVLKKQDSMMETTLLMMREASKTKVMQTMRESMSQFPRLLELSRSNLQPGDAAQSKDFAIVSRTKKNYYSTLRSTSSSFFMGGLANGSQTQRTVTVSRGIGMPPPNMGDIQLASKYGQPRHLNRTVLNSFTQRPAHDAIPDLLKLADALGLDNAAYEGDLYWVVVFVYLIQENKNRLKPQSRINNTGGSDLFSSTRRQKSLTERNFSQLGTQMDPFYLQLIQHQRHRRKMAENSLPRDVFDGVTHALSWIGFDDQHNTPVFYNFKTGKQTISIVSRELQLMSVYHNYLPNK